MRRASEKAIASCRTGSARSRRPRWWLKHAHWNVTGPNFIAVHEMLDPQVEAMLGMADETAERIATMGGAPDGSADAITRNRTWKPFDLEGRHSTEEYLQALIEYYDAMIVDDRKRSPSLTNWIWSARTSCRTRCRSWRSSSGSCAAIWPDAVPIYTERESHTAGGCSAIHAETPSGGFVSTYPAV